MLSFNVTGHLRAPIMETKPMAYETSRLTRRTTVARRIGEGIKQAYATGSPAVELNALRLIATAWRDEQERLRQDAETLWQSFDPKALPRWDAKAFLTLARGKPWLKRLATRPVPKPAVIMAASREWLVAYVYACRAQRKGLQQEAESFLRFGHEMRSVLKPMLRVERRALLAFWRALYEPTYGKPLPQIEAAFDEIMSRPPQRPSTRSFSGH
jgi:hypothetical protein